MAQSGDEIVQASFSDDLSQVANASYVAGSASANRGTVTGEVNWSGQLAKGETATVTYQMRVADDAATPTTVRNTVVPGEGGSCATDGCVTTTQVTTPGSFDVTKSVSKAEAVAGEILTYTVTVRHLGGDPVSASFTDDLSAVENASYVIGSAQASQGVITGAVNWSGILERGAVVTVTYQVTKAADKASAPSGAVITYTVTVVQRGGTAVQASFTDDLSRVSGARYVAGSAVADRGTVTGEVNWSGQLAKGETATVTYQMVIAAESGTVRNVVVPGEKGQCETGACETVTEVIVVPPPTVEPPVVEPPKPVDPGETLPETGASSVPWLFTGSGLLLAGLMIVIGAAVRRRHKAAAETSDSSASADGR